MDRSRRIGLFLCVLVLLTLLGSAAVSLAQSAPWRVVQASDGTLYLLKDGVRYAIVGDAIDDEELEAYADGGATGASLLLNLAPVALPPQIEAAPAPPEEAAPADQPETRGGAPAGTAKSTAGGQAPPPQPAPAAGLQFLRVQGGSPGGPASVTVQAAPGATCTLSFDSSTAARRITSVNLGPQSVGPSGTATWTWTIDGATVPGSHRVTLSCGGATISSPIQIGGLSR